MGKYEKAIKYLEMDNETEGQNFGAHLYKGLVYNTLGKDEEADRELLKAVEWFGKVDDKEEELNHLEVIKNAVPERMDYFDRFSSLIIKT